MLKTVKCRNDILNVKSPRIVIFSTSFYNKILLDEHKYFKPYAVQHFLIIDINSSPYFFSFLETLRQPS